MTYGVDVEILLCREAREIFMNTGMRQMDIATVKAKTAREDWGNVGIIREI